MKRKALLLLLVLCLLISCLGACNAEKRRQGSGKIYLYGENHSVDTVMEMELDLWSDYYHNDGMRHLFIEDCYFTAAYLNLWMQSDNDDILNALYDDWEGTVSHTPLTLEFYKRIKAECPETVFHGTDVGHQYKTIGKRFLEYLEETGQKDTELYKLSQENMEQGRYYYEHLGDPAKKDNVYRENKMAENFIREFDSLNGKEDIMGIYGDAHTWTDAMDWATQTVPSMGNQLYQKYDDKLTAEDLKADPIRTDTLTVAGKEYTASYFGRADRPNQSGSPTLEYWRLEDAYEDFQNKFLVGGGSSPCNNFPMKIEEGQVLLVRWTTEDGSVNEAYYRSDGTLWQGRPAVRRFDPDKP